MRYCLGLVYFLFLHIGLVQSLIAQEGAFACVDVVSDSKVLSKVQAAYASVTSLSSEFVQSSYLDALDIHESSRGSMWFERPGQMRWSYKVPEVQEFIIKGNVFWFYQVEDQQLTIDAFDQVLLSDLPVAFLMGLGSLEKDFRLEKLCSNPSGLVLSLVPVRSKKQEGAMQNFALLVDPNSFRPKGAEIQHQGGNRTALLLESVEFNRSLKKAIFETKFPAEVDVIDRRK